jgi:phage baseplate assembly protein V
VSANLEARISQLERQLASLISPGRVSHVDAAGKRVRIDLGDADEPMLSPWVRYAQIAGKLKVHTLPTVGQQMTLFSASGDFEQGLALPLGWSNDHVSPGNDEDPVLAYGQVQVVIEDAAIQATIGAMTLRFDAGDGLTIVVGGSSFTVSPDQIRASSDEIRTSGATVLNDGTRQVVYKGSTDTHGDTNNQGAGDGVLV